VLGSGKHRLGAVNAPTDPTTPLPIPGTECPVCGHEEDVHIYAPADECGGWAHCTVGSGEESCMCWRD
jgi:hypothetical protein